MDPRDLQVASFRGVEFVATGGGVTGGRKTVVKRFVDSDRQVVEDLGLLQRGFRVEGVVTARRDNSGNVIRTYQQARDSLLEALELGGTGVLVHPFLGRIADVAVTSYEFSESTTRLGDSPITIEFAISNTDGAPKQRETVLQQVVGGADSAAEAAESSVADGYGVTPGFGGNFEDAVAKVLEIGAAVQRAARVSPAIEENLDGFERRVEDFGADATSLAGDPTGLASAGASLLGAMNQLHATKQETFDAYARLFDFGDLEGAISATTAGLLERLRNRRVLNGFVQTTALARSYEAAAQLDFATVEDVDSVAGILEAQYQKMAATGTLDQGAEEALASLRVVAGEFFDQQRALRPRVIEVTTPPTSARLLAYQYYGSSDQGETIAELNGLDDPSFVEGRVRILTA